MPLGVDFGRSKLGQLISGFLLVFVKELGAKFVVFSSIGSGVSCSSFPASSVVLWVAQSIRGADIFQYLISLSHHLDSVMLAIEASPGAFIHIIVLLH